MRARYLLLSMQIIETFWRVLLFKKMEITMRIISRFVLIGFCYFLSVDIVYANCCIVAPTNATDVNPVKPCGCPGLTATECGANAQCKSTGTSPGLETYCATYNTTATCPSSICLWSANTNVCFAPNCADTTCYDLNPSRATQCQARPDCWREFSIIANPNSCHVFAECSSSDPNNLTAYCPCLRTQEQCMAKPGCGNWQYNASGARFQCYGAVTSTGESLQNTLYIQAISVFLALYYLIS